ncbi:hypothetical protein ACFQRC_04380 [Enterovirga sp. GCM10030262]|uniref:hypothetical protein n=1 Tax=Enterovirga sp. GCM10030262 TaxID=3273391 RepID=UPI0036172B46
MGEDGFEEGPPLFRTERQLDELEVWLASRAGETTIFDVISSGDGELLAAYILKAFRAAARQAVIDHLEHHAKSTFGYGGAEVDDAAYRVFSGITDAWDLSRKERVVLLGLDNAVEAGPSPVRLGATSHQRCSSG